jgi:hypothetical protein
MARLITEDPTRTLGEQLSKGVILRSFAHPPVRCGARWRLQNTCSRVGSVHRNAVEPSRSGPARYEGILGSVSAAIRRAGMPEDRPGPFSLRLAMAFPSISGKNTSAKTVSLFKSAWRHSRIVCVKITRSPAPRDSWPQARRQPDIDEPSANQPCIRNCTP